MLALASSVLQFLAADLFIAVGSSICSAVGSSLLADAGEPEYTGVLMGLSESAQALAGVLAPTVGGYLYEYHGNASPGWVSSLLCLIAVGVFVGSVGSPQKNVSVVINPSQKHASKIA
eukprot:TRINITY_DN12018_c0_g1_i1.p1 TRINITY_DN12018_c0_g1~~TRINITY_DN12018_c0_g1_i1.p1  ORF type:complete len:118 (-),score=19.39 TRINITY_DN12018_c0_g1_i1:132-485(-)